MEASRKEIEVKLRFGSCREALDAVRKLGASPLEQRTFEDNILYDRPDRSLKKARQMLRLRQVGSRAVLTHKSRPERGRHKVWQEHETAVAELDEMRRILELLGYEPAYRYQKYRTRFTLDGVEVCIDETPLGCFVELEGSPGPIDQVASRLGFTADRYIVKSYRELHEEAAAASGTPPGDLLMR